MTLESAIDELTAYNDLLEWCDNYLANQQLELLAIALNN